ncbi:MAG: hypothetical protein LHV69_10460, partial [Elusimicrobia bacterium]|nr:hypothetical protein [Candidatus Obscuribacterium magneticum]
LKGRELHIHDMKTVNHLPVALRTIERQLEDPFILEATEELLAGRRLPFKRPPKKKFLYGAPAPEFEGVRSEKGVNERSRWRAPQKDQGGQKQ